MNYYIVEIKGKNPKRLLTKIFKLNIDLYDIKYEYNRIVFKVSYEDYLKIKSIKTTYEINIIGVHGIKKINSLMKKYLIFLIFFLLSIVFIFVISHMTFFININSTNKEMIKLLEEELENNDISLFGFKKSYSNLELISRKIKNNNMNKIEWLSLYYDGVYLNVDVIERLKDEDDEVLEYNDIVASKNGYIKDIYAKSGELLKVKEDYVKEGEVIISGNIFRNGKVIGKTSAKGEVYAEVWYKVKLNKPITVEEQEKTNKGYVMLSIEIFDKKINLFKIEKKIKNEFDRKIFSSNLINIFYSSNYIYKTIEKTYETEELTKSLEDIATSSITDTLDDNEYIIMQKTLKNYEENGRIYIEVFFKVYENIAKEEKLKEIEEEKEE